MLSLSIPLQAAVQVPIYELASLNGKTKQEIFELRKERVQEHAELAPSHYSPSEAVFGQIIDGKPWWGMLGICGYGPGQKSIEGPSRESEFVMNPYILIGLKNNSALIASGKGYIPSFSYPIPLALFWDKEAKSATVTYDVRSFWSWQKRMGDAASVGTLCLNTYNARDFGYAYFSIDPDYSENVSGAAVGKIAPNIQFVHCGSSCGYPGGCNNESPYQPETVIKISRLPAHASIKLWKNRPASVSAPADMTFIVEMM